MLGRGLESLIPNTRGNEPHNAPHHPAPAQHAQPSHAQPNPHIPATPRVSYPQASAPMPRQEASIHFSHLSEQPVQREEARPARAEPEPQYSVFHIELDKIAPNPYQPRREFDEQALEELAQSIREFGVLQPIIVSKVLKEAESGADVEYHIIAGERRWRASRLARLERIPVIVKKVDTGRVKLELALLENIQRSNLNPLESARAYSRLQDEFGLTQREIAVRLGKSREVVANSMRLLNLPSQIQDALAQGKLSESQGRALLAVHDPSEQIRMFEAILNKKPVVRGAKELLSAAQDPQQKYWEGQLEEKIGAPVKIKRQGGGGGMINIQYYSSEELQGILERLIGGQL